MTLLSASGLVNGPLGPVDLELEAGECVVVQGPSGSGKSLLLRAMADLDPAAGDVRLGGADRAEIDGPAWRRRIGYVPAEPGWWSDDPRAHFEDPERAAEMAARLGLDPGALARSVARLSTGERQRLALVRALLLEPEVLLLDEPTAALDPKSTLAAEELVGEQLRRGMGVVWVSHDPEQTARVATRVVTLTDGSIVEERRP